MAYLLSNICTKNYCNQTAVVEIIDGGWAVSFFETLCTLRHFVKAGPVVYKDVRF